MWRQIGHNSHNGQLQVNEVAYTDRDRLDVYERWRWINLSVSFKGALSSDAAAFGGSPNCLETFWGSVQQPPHLSTPSKPFTF